MTQPTPPPSSSSWAFGAGVALSLLAVGSKGRAELVHPTTGDPLGPPSYQVCAVDLGTTGASIVVLYHSADDQVIVRRDFDPDVEAALADPVTLYATLDTQGSAMTATVASQLVCVLAVPENDNLGVCVLPGDGPHDATAQHFGQVNLGIIPGAAWISFAALPAVAGEVPVLAAATRSTIARGTPGNSAGLEMYLFRVRPGEAPGPARLAAKAVLVSADPPFLPHAVAEGYYFDAQGVRVRALFAAGRADPERGNPALTTLQGGGAALTPAGGDGIWRSDDGGLSWALVRRTPWAQGHARLEEVAAPLGGPAPAAGLPAARDTGIAYDAPTQRVLFAGVGNDPTTPPARARPRYVKP